jgi:hypothetical protein
MLETASPTCPLHAAANATVSTNAPRPDLRPHRSAPYIVVGCGAITGSAGRHPSLRQPVRHLLTEDTLDLPAFRRDRLGDDPQDLGRVGQLDDPQHVGSFAQRTLERRDLPDLVEELGQDLADLVDVLVVRQPESTIARPHPRVLLLVTRMFPFGTMLSVPSNARTVVIRSVSASTVPATVAPTSGVRPCRRRRTGSRPG